MNEEDYIRVLAHRVRLTRTHLGVTQEQLGELSSLSRSFVSVFENGGHGIQVLSLRRVAASLGVTFSALVHDPTDPGGPLLVPDPPERSAR